MRHVPRLLSLAVGLAVLASVGAAEQPTKTTPKEGAAKSPFVEAFVARIMAFDKNQDGKLTRDEITDGRLLRLFDRADVNKDGVVTKEQLVALGTQLAAEQVADGRQRGGPGGAPGGPGGDGPGGPGGGPGGPGGRGPGGPGGPPQPGQILPSGLQDRLNLTPDQKKQLDALQKEVDSKLGQILTDDQKKQLKDMRQGGGRRGPGGRGPGGPGGGPGGPGGGPGGPGGGPGGRNPGGPPPGQ